LGISIGQGYHIWGIQPIASLEVTQPSSEITLPGFIGVSGIMCNRLPDASVPAVALIQQCS